MTDTYTPKNVDLTLTLLHFFEFHKSGSYMSVFDLTANKFHHFNSLADGNSIPSEDKNKRILFFFKPEDQNKNLFWALQNQYYSANLVMPIISGEGYLFIHVTFTDDFMTYYNNNENPRLQLNIIEALTIYPQKKHNGYQLFEKVVREYIQ